MGGEVELLERVRGLVAEEADLPIQAVTAQTTVGSLGLDSLEMAQLVITLEDALNVDLVDADLGRLTTLGELVTWMTASAKP